MNIREYEGFQIQIHNEGSGHIAEVYRKVNLLKTVRDEKGADVFPFKTITLAFEAARGWIDQTYPKRIKYKGYVQASLPNK
jgi:hypothetical protein